ncbi:MAG: polymer-forming cytoskeletal protein [Bacteroidota bacterium]
MFGNSNGKDDKKGRTEGPGRSTSGSSGGHGLNTITDGTRIEGDIKANSDFRIDGHIKGTLNCTAKVIIGVKGKFEGEISCENAVIEGTFTGQLNVRDMLNLKETAKVDGQVSTNRLAVAPGCDLNGTCSTSVKPGSSAASNGNPLTSAAKKP